MRTLIAAFSFIFLASCAAITTDHGPVKTEDRKTAVFSSIKASGAVEIDYTTGTAASVIIEAPADILPLIQTEVKEGVLCISNKDDIQNLKQPVKIHIQSAELNKVKMTGACSFDLKSPLNNTNFDIDLSGASSFYGTIYNTETKIDMTGASVAEIGGITNLLTIKASGASSLNASKLSSIHADVEANGASNTSLSADSSLQAKASGASSISYSGNPVQIDKQSSGASTIKKK